MYMHYSLWLCFITVIDGSINALVTRPTYLPCVSNSLKFKFLLKISIITIHNITITIIE